MDFEANFFVNHCQLPLLFDQQVSPVSIRPLDSPQWTLEWASGFDVVASSQNVAVKDFSLLSLLRKIPFSLHFKPNSACKII